MIDTVRLCCYSRRPGKCSHRTFQATAIDTVKDIAASHGDTGVAKHISLTTATIDALANRNAIETSNTSIIGCADIDRGITIYIGLTTATKHITCDSCSRDRNIIESICLCYRHARSFSKMNRFCYISYSCFSSYIDRRITSNHTLVTTAKDITNDTDRIWYELSLICLSCPPAFRHVDIYLSITINVRL